MNYLAISLCLIPAACAALSMGIATAIAVQSTARQPEASGKITAVLMVGMALTESCAIYGFVVALLMFFRA